MKKLMIALSSLAFVACGCEEQVNVAVLMDENPSTAYLAEDSAAPLIFDGFETPIMSYKVYSSGEKPELDPKGWVLSASFDGKEWVEVDRQQDVEYCSRFQEHVGVIKTPAAYSAYKLELIQDKGNQVAVGDVRFLETNAENLWQNFKYPAVDFQIQTPDTKGETIYRELVQNPEEYVRYHTRKVAEILFYSANDPMNSVGKINYYLKSYKGISAKSGTPAETSIVYSTNHIEKSAEESMYKLDYETRGVLYHELTHAYQFEPKGIGTYGTSKEFWACIEGLADAVRAHAGLFDFKTMRKAGGNWMDGYKTTGFFIEWLTTKDADAIRKFHITVRDMEKWSFEAAILEVTGRPIQEVWDEYQEFLLAEQHKTE